MEKSNTHYPPTLADLMGLSPQGIREFINREEKGKTEGRMREDRV
jgi:hypothetical protein